MVVAVLLVRVMQMARDEIVYVVTVRNHGMTTRRSVLVGGPMSVTAVFRGAVDRIPFAHADAVLVDMIPVREVHVAVV